MDAVPEPPNPPPLPLGQLLAAERERQGMSRADAAQRLHMSAWQIEALEAGDYSRLPTGTFLRGFVRNYTRMLGLNPDAALDALAHTRPSGPAPAIVVPTQNIRFDPLGERLASPWVKAWGVAGVTFALALAATYWWVFVRPAPPAVQGTRKEAVQQPVPQNLAAPPVSAPEPVAPRDAPRMEEPAKAQTPGTPVRPLGGAPAPTGPRPAKPPDVLPAAVVAPAPAGARPAGTSTITLRFRGHSWVEIRERGGKVVFQGLNDAGSQAEVSGRPPFSVIVGNAPGVSLLYEGREFALEPHTRVAVARFTLE